MLIGNNRLHILKAAFFQRLFHLIRRSRRNAVDHGPWECHFLFSIHIVVKFFFREPVFHPDFSYGAHACFQFFAVVRAIIHADNRQRILSRFKTLVEHSGHDTHRMMRRRRADLKIRLNNREIVPVHVFQGISFFCDCEADHLQGRIPENALQLSELSGVSAVRLDAFRDASDHLLIKFSVRIQQNQHRQVVKRPVNLPDDIKVEGLSRNDACLLFSLIQKLLLDLRDEAAENIARSEMNPYRILLRLLPHCLNIKFRQDRAALFPCRFIL